MPTKKRREKEQERAKDAEETRQRHDKIFAITPTHVHAFPFDNLSGYVNEGPPSKLAKLRGLGLVDGDEFGNTFPNRKLMGSRANKANEYRHLDQGRRATILKRLYPDLWGKRGTAKLIAQEESKQQREITIRTIQRYQKRYP